VNLASCLIAAANATRLFLPRLLSPRSPGKVVVRDFISGEELSLAVVPTARPYPAVFYFPTFHHMPSFIRSGSPDLLCHSRSGFSNFHLLTRPHLRFRPVPKTRSAEFFVTFRLAVLLDPLPLLARRLHLNSESHFIRRAFCSPFS